MRAVQSTPLLSRSGKLLGILTTQWGFPYIPDEHDLWRIDLLARQAAPQPATDPFGLIASTATTASAVTPINPPHIR